MKLKIILLISIILSITGCSNSKKESTVINYNKIEIDRIIDEHLTHTIQIFQDSMDHKKGVLGWRNIRDYIHLGDETLNKKTIRIWNKVYDNESLQNKINQNLKTNQPIIIKLDKSNEHIKQYGHKISLSLIILIAEGFFEFLLNLFLGFVFAAVVVFLFVFYQFAYGGWIRMSKKRRDRIDNLGYKATRWASYIALVVSITIGIYNGDYSEKILKEKIKSDIKNDISIQIENKLGNS